MMISKVRGRFGSFTGTVDFNEASPGSSSVDIQIAAASIDTRDERRDGHLKSPDFLNAEAFPQLTFKSSRVEEVDSTHGRIVGDLTIRDVTREVVHQLRGPGQKPLGNHQRRIQRPDHDQSPRLGPDLEPDAGDRRNSGRR